MPAQDTVEIPVTVSLSRQSYDKLNALIPGDELPAHKVSSVVQGLVDDFSGGGIMLGPEDVAQIHEAIPDAESGQIVEAVQESAGMEDGTVVVKWPVDNTMLEPLQQIADQAGMTVQEIVENMMSMAINEGWFYDILLVNKALWFDKEMFSFVQQLTGNEHVTGETLVQFLREHTEEPGQSLEELFKEEPVTA